MHTIAFVLAALLPAVPPQDKAELEKLKGTWIVESLQRGDEADPNAKGNKFIVENDRFTIKTNSGEMKGTLWLDGSKKPSQMDVMITDGPQTGTALGICEVKGDELRVALSQPGGKERPKELVAKAGAMYLYIVLKREKR